MLPNIFVGNHSLKGKQCGKNNLRNGSLGRSGRGSALILFYSRTTSLTINSNLEPHTVWKWKDCRGNSRILEFFVVKTLGVSKLEIHACMQNPSF